MKVLIAYDGSRCSDAALDDLVRAGLPADCESIAISVAEGWLPSTGSERDPQRKRDLQDPYKKNEKVVAEAVTLANHAKKRLQGMFPHWRVRSEATYGSPAAEILTRADEFAPDLVVVGSHGTSTINRLLLGSISQKVLTEAQCSVRVARGRIDVDPTPARILIGFDGSKGAEAAVEAVAARPGRESSEIRLVAALEDSTPSAIGRFISPISPRAEVVSRPERERIESLADTALEKLRSETVSTTLHFYAGNPRDVLIEAAERWNADCIFVGANALGSKTERFLLGTTSAAVAARARCSVEIVRKQL